MKKKTKSSKSKDVKIFLDKNELLKFDNIVYSNSRINSFIGFIHSANISKSDIIIKELEELYYKNCIKSLFNEFGVFESDREEILNRVKFLDGSELKDEFPHLTEDEILKCNTELNDCYLKYNTYETGDVDLLDLDCSPYFKTYPILGIYTERYDKCLSLYSKDSDMV